MTQPITPDTPILEFFDTVYLPKKLRGAAKTTVKQYRITIGQFSRHIGHPATLADLTDEAVTDFCWKRIEDGKANASAWKNGMNLCVLWRFACRQNILHVWPELSLPEMPDRVPNAWSDPQMRRLFAAIDATPGEIGDIPARLWWRALVLLIWDTGERVGAVTRIQWDDVDVETGWVTIRAETRKGKRRDIARHLHPETAAVLRLIREPERRLILPWHRCWSLLFTHFGKVLKSAGLQNGRRFKFHCLRRTVASHFAAAGGDPVALLDHSSAEITRHYLDPKIVKQKQAADLLFRPADGDTLNDTPKEWSIVHGVGATNRRKSHIFLRGRSQPIPDSVAILLECVRDNPDGISLHDVTRVLATVCFEKEHVISQIVVAARVFVREALDLPPELDPLPVTDFSRGVGVGHRGTIRLNLPGDLNR